MKSASQQPQQPSTDVVRTLRTVNVPNELCFTVVDDNTVAVADRGKTSETRNNHYIYLWDLKTNIYASSFFPEDAIRINELYLATDPNFLCSRFTIANFEQKKQVWSLRPEESHFAAKTVPPRKKETSETLVCTYSLIDEQHSIRIKSKTNILEEKSGAYIAIYNGCDSAPITWQLIPYYIQSIQYNGRYLFLEMMDRNIRHNPAYHFIAVLEIKHNEDYLKSPLLAERERQRAECVAATLQTTFPTGLISIINRYSLFRAPDPIQSCSHQPLIYESGSESITVQQMALRLRHSAT